MAAVQWDRLLETCYRRGGTDLLLTPGSSPMIRLADAWHDLQAPILEREEVEVAAREKIAEPDGKADGYAYSDICHSRAGKFRVTAFGYPQAKLLLVTRYPDQAV